MAKTIDEIVAEAKQGLTGEESVDMLHLEHIVKEYAGTELGKEVESRMADLAYDILPDEKKEHLAKMLYINGKRMDKVFAEHNVEKRKFITLIDEDYPDTLKCSKRPPFVIEIIN